MNPIDRGILRAFVILQKENLITNVEKAARSLGVHGVASTNSNDQLWALAHAEWDAASPVVEGPYVPETPPVIVGSEPVVEIATENPPGGQRPGVRPTVLSTKKAGK